MKLATPQVEIKRLDLAWRLLGRPGEITSDHFADGVSAEVMNNNRTFLVLRLKRRASVRLSITGTGCADNGGIRQVRAEPGGSIAATR